MPPGPQIIIRKAANPLAVKWAKKYAAKLVKDITKSTRDSIREKVIDAMTEGRSVRDLAREIYEDIGDKKRALVIARTETLRAGNEGQRLAWEDAVEEGLIGEDSQRTWLFAELPMKNGDLCPVCSSMADQKRGLDEPFEDDDGNTYDSPPAHPNCILPGQDVQGALTGGLRAFYDGPAREFKTRNGNILRLTVNHPILTARGWVKTSDMRPGDQVLSQARDVKFGRVFPWLNDQEHSPALVEQIFESFMSNGLTAVQPRELDLYGDARFVQGDIDVVSIDRPLLSDVDALCSQHKRELVFTGALSQQAGVDSLRPSQFGGQRIDLTASLVPSSTTLTFNTAGRVLNSGPLNALLLGLATYWDVQRSEPTLQDAAADARFMLELQERSAGLIAFDEIIEIRDFNFCGHVYDFESKYGWILSQNIVISNCRCTTGLVAKRVRQRGRRPRAAIGNGNNQYTQDNPTRDDRQVAVASALKDYTTTGGSYKRMNEDLRSGKLTGDDPTVALIDEAFKIYGEPAPKVLYRGLAGFDLEELGIGSVDSEFLDKAFVSTSVKSASAAKHARAGMPDMGGEEAVGVLFKINTGGIIGLDTNRFSNYEEQEFLLPRGTRFKVTSVVPGIPGEKLARVTMSVLHPRTAIGNGNNQYTQDNPTSTHAGRQRVLHGYVTGRTHIAVNDFLRGTNTEQPKAQRDGEFRAKQLVAAFDDPDIARVDPEPATVYRGISNESAYAQLAKLEVGDEITDKAFLATSTDRNATVRQFVGERAPSVLLEVRVPAKKVYLPGRTSERVYRNGTKLRVTYSVVDFDGVLRMTAEML